MRRSARGCFSARKEVINVPIVQHEPFEPINQQPYNGQRLGIKLQDGTVDPIPQEAITMVLTGDFPALRIMDVAPLSRLPIVIID